MAKSRFRSLEGVSGQKLRHYSISDPSLLTVFKTYTRRIYLTVKVSSNFRLDNNVGNTFSAARGRIRLGVTSLEAQVASVLTMCVVNQCLLRRLGRKQTASNLRQGEYPPRLLTNTWKWEIVASNHQGIVDSQALKLTEQQDRSIDFQLPLANSPKT